VSALVALGAALAVLLVADVRRPAARGVDGCTPAGATGSVPALRRAGAVVERAGRRARSLAGRRPDRTADRRAGAVLATALGAVVLGPVPAVAAVVVVGLLVRAARLRRLRTAPRGVAVERDLPDLVDLLALAVGAGVPLPAAVPAIAPLAPPALRDDLVAAADALAGGRASDEVVVELGRRWGPPARPLVHALADHLRYGTPVLPALDRVAADARAARRRAAETRARRLPVLLLLPLVLCTLPAFGLLTVAPLVAGTFDSLRGGHLEAPASVAP